MDTKKRKGEPLNSTLMFSICITVAKVGSSDIFHSVKQKYKAHRGHSLLHLKNVLKNDKTH